MFLQKIHFCIIKVCIPSGRPKPWYLDLLSGSPSRKHDGVQRSRGHERRYAAAVRVSFQFIRQWEVGLLDVAEFSRKNLIYQCNFLIFPNMGPYVLNGKIKTGGFLENWMKIWTSWLCGVHMGSFDLEHITVILGSCGALFSELDTNSKKGLIVEQNRRKFGPRGHTCMRYMYERWYFWPWLCRGHFGGLSVHFSQNCAV